MRKEIIKREYHEYFKKHNCIASDATMVKRIFGKEFNLKHDDYEQKLVAVCEARWEMEKDGEIETVIRISPTGKKMKIQVIA